MHRYFKPYTEQTIFLLKRILADLIDSGVQMSGPDVRIAAKILSSKQMSELLFTSFAEAIQVLSPIVDSLLADINLRAATLNKSQNENFVIKIEEWIQDFQALANIALLSGVGVRGLANGDGTAQALRQKILEEVAPAAFNLLKQELFKTSSFPSASNASG